ncbi:hypothetical protein C5167_038300 [Papaver somniferum]|uniref:Small ribosomal subunit protein uS4c n=1 Tax=Papaver somniferum TaxID=3469 RepID=A0A4Y7I8R6_PAPSO|nr:hypothetical protein C5167_038300 [Papaver somniferum]
MSRYRGPHFKKIRRLGDLPGLTSKRPKAGNDLRNQSCSGKKSQYRIRLEEKQKLRFHYGMTERQLLKYVRIAGKAKGSTGQVLLQLLEMRLDNILFRLGYPQGVVGCFLPIGALPSLPPWGWSTGFINTPLTTGSLPSQRLDPALPKLFWFTPTLPTCSTVAEQFLDIKRTSPDGNFNVADLPSFAISFATAPAALANYPPFPSVISMLCMAVPKGISVEVDSSF